MSFPGIQYTIPGVNQPATWLAITDTYGVMRPIPSQIKGLSLSIVAVALPASHTPAAISVLFVCLTKCFRIQISRKQLDSGICVYDREALGTPLCKNQPSAAYFSYYLRFQQGCSWL
ncbi:hypothetical protein BC832DRAFT_303470 [Gaertneriomyces semiglobifer]|nr:hypothetical protein BC832DRAFT_303470 [Gaertneriomyces semiglobifer]